MNDRALTYEQQVRYESLQGDLETLVETADASIPIPKISQDFLGVLVRQGSFHATLPRRFLERCGYEVRSPDDLDDGGLPAELWKVIWTMALLRMFLKQTDHLSDRELYTFLYDDALQEPTAFMPGEENPPFYTIEPLADSSPDSIRLLLTYYGDTLDQEQRDQLSKDLAGEPIVAQTLPYERDWMLP